MAETVLVTGGSGFVGGWCVKELLARGYQVRATLRSLDKEPGLRRAVGAEGEPRLSVAVADLTDDAGWPAAMAGVDYVLHVASPLGAGGASDADLIAPARDGTLRVLAAALGAGVKRVVMTSAAATARPRRASGLPSVETVWADPADPQFDGYRRSKILAERAAWDFMESRGASDKLTTILPGAVFGPVLSRENLGSVGIILGLLKGRPARVPRFGFWVVDVRDLADIHIRAMSAPQAAGQRFIAAGDFVWMGDIARALREGLGEAGAKAPTKTMPDLAVKIAALFQPQLRFFAGDVGLRRETVTAKARELLGFAPRPVAQTVVDCARSVVG